MIKIIDDTIIGWRMPDLSRSYLKQPFWCDLCEFCQINKATTGHHCLEGRRKGHPELDLPYNIMMACFTCHIDKKLLDSREVSEWFWAQQCRRIGEPKMRDWLNNLNLKIITIY